MHTLSIGQLTELLKDPNNDLSLAIETILVTKNNNAAAWIVPVGDVPNMPIAIQIVGSMPLKVFRGQIGYQIQRLRQLRHKKGDRVIHAIALYDRTDQFCSYFSIDSRLVPAEELSHYA